MNMYVYTIQICTAGELSWVHDGLTSCNPTLWKANPGDCKWLYKNPPWKIVNHLALSIKKRGICNQLLNQWNPMNPWVWILDILYPKIADLIRKIMITQWIYKTFKQPDMKWLGPLIYTGGDWVGSTGWCIRTSSPKILSEKTLRGSASHIFMGQFFWVSLETLLWVIIFIVKPSIPLLNGRSSGSDSMEVLYHIPGHIFRGYSLKFRPEK